MCLNDYQKSYGQLSGTDSDMAPFPPAVPVSSHAA